MDKLFKFDLDALNDMRIMEGETAPCHRMDGAPLMAC